MASLSPQSSGKIRIILRLPDHSEYKLGLGKVFNSIIFILNVVLLPEYSSSEVASSYHSLISLKLALERIHSALQQVRATKSRQARI